MKKRSDQRAAPQQSVATRLLGAILAKSFLEVVLVCVVATLAAFSTFSPVLRGAIDVADQHQIAGWALDPLTPDEAIEVQLFIDGKFLATKSSDERRDDLVEAGAATKPNHGFTFLLESFNLPSGNHIVQVYAVRDAVGANKSLLPLAKKPRTIEINARY